MKSNYARKLNKANIILGIHIAFKLVIILTLFIILFTTIWVKQIYLTIIKSSVYIQLFIFLTLALVMLAINNPKQFDICSPFLNYFYIIISILQIGIIISEIYFLIQNMKNFISIFHECPYYRTYEEISIQDYKRTCLYYITDYNNELPYKYICYYNSENEYQNRFCDGIFCKKNYNKNEINTHIKCYGNVDIQSINFSGDNEFYLKEIELIHKYKSSNLFACFRKEKLIKDENIFNQNCPDSNPIKKMIIFIYSDILLHLIDFLFLYEFFILRKINEIYSNLVLLQSRAPVDYLPNEDDLRNNSNTKKDTLYTENRELMAHPQTINTFYNQKEISQTIIIEPGFKNNNIINLRKDRKDSNYQNDYVNIEVNNNEKKEISNENENIQTNENTGVINRKSKIFNLKKKNYEFNEENELKKNKKKMIIIDIKKDEELGINRINFFIRKKNRKKKNKKKKGQEQDEYNKVNNNSDEQLNTISTNINEQNKEDNKLIKDKNNLKKINITSKLKNQENIKNEIENKTSLNENKNNKLRKTKLNKKKFNLDIKSNSNILLEKKNNNFMVNFKKELSENNLYSNYLKRNNSGDKIIHNSLKNDIKKNTNINKNRNILQFNEEKTRKKAYKNLINSAETEEIKENEKEIDFKNNINKKDNISKNKEDINYKNNQINDNMIKDFNI